MTDIPLEALLFFVLVLSVFLGLELIAKVPSILHTPLMSGANAISGVALVGALLVAGLSPEMISQESRLVAAGAVLFASINVAGGYLVTDRMLRLFKERGRQQPAASVAADEEGK